MTATQNRWLPLLALVALSFFWGYTWVLAKEALQYAGPFTFAAQRAVGGALALMLALRLTGRSLKLPAPGPTMLIGLVQTGGFLIFQTWALVEGGAGKTAVLIFTMPIWTLLLAWPILGERIRGGQWLAAGSTLVGLVLIIAPWDMHTSLFSKMLGVVAALFWAVGSILVKRLRARPEKFDLLGLTGWQMVFGAMLVVVVSLLVPERAVAWTPHYVGTLTFMAVVSTALCWFLWLYILDRLPAWEASLSVLGTPVIAMVASRIQTGESFSRSELSGVLLIAVGLALLSLLGWWSTRKPGGEITSSD
jgi:drug/metabolite transporter (DMT)-like permease